MSPTAPQSAGAKFDDQSATNPRLPAKPARAGLFGRATIIPLVLLLVGVGAGFSGAIFSGKTTTNATTEEGSEEAASPIATDGAAPPSIGGTASPVTTTAGPGTAVTNLGAFTVNLRGGAGGRVLRLEVQIETPLADAAGVTARSAPLRDSIITAVSDYTWSELEGAEGKTRLRDELITRVNGVLAPSTIGRLYFTQFVIQ